MTRRAELNALQREKRQSIVAMARLGFTDEQIGERVGLGSSRVAALRRQEGFKRPKANDPDPELVERIKHLSEVEQWPPEEISKTLGISIYQANRWATPGPGMEWRDVAIWASRNHRELWEELR